MNSFEKFHIRLKELGFSSYQEYLQSDHWRKLKQRYYNSRCPKVCFVCNGLPIEPNFHHRTYARLGKERLGDIVLVCRKCHELIHSVFNERYFKQKRKTTLWITTKFVARRRTRVRTRIPKVEDRGAETHQLFLV